MANKTIAQYPAAPVAVEDTDLLLIQRGSAYYYVTRAVLVAGLAGGGGGGGDVASVFGRTGTVVATSGDYTFAQIGSKPTTLAGYGIADAAPLTHVGAGGTAHANVVSGGAAGFITGANQAKLDSIATGATVNSTDATLLARNNHTGTQIASTIQDFAEAVDDRVAALLVAGANITLNYNDAGNALTISAAGGGGGATLADGDYTDITVTGTGTILTIDPGVVTLAKMADLATDRLVGRDTAGTGAPEPITLNATLEFNGAQAIQRAALTGDVTAGAGSNATTVVAGAITLAKMADLAQDQFIGRTTASTGVPQTATITAAARTVLDDVSVDAMLNTLGGATATGTGAVVRATSPTLVTPILGVAAATSIALGGGTALATTNRTGTGNLVLNTDPTITRLVTSGITTGDGANVTTANAMGALAIDVTRGLNTKSISADSTFTFSGTPATANTWFGMLVTNTDTAPHILTFPLSFDFGQQGARTTTPIAASGRLYLVWNYNGSTYNVFGASGFLNRYDATAAPTASNDVSQGYGPGSIWLNATSNITYICETNGAAAAVWNVMGGGVSDADYGDVTVASGVWTIDPGVVTLAKMANIATDRLIGRDTTGTGVPEAIAVTGGIEFDGTGNIRTTAFTGDVTKSAGGTALTIANSAVTLAKMADLVQSRFIGRVTASTGVPESMTGTQATTLLDTFTSGLKGLVPASGGGTTNFLRADGSFAAPAGGGTVTNTGNLTLNSLVLGNAVTDSKVVAGITSDGVSKITLGVSGVSVGGLLMANATSGTLELRPATGALGTGVITVPAATDTMVLLAATQTLTNKTLTAPVLTTPTLGAATATTLNGNAFTTGTYTLTGGAGKTLTFNNTITLAGTDATTMTLPPASASLGYLGVPQNSQSAPYTLVLDDAGKHILHPSADTTARTFTIPANSSVAYPIGTKLCFINQNAAGVVTIAITTDTMRLAGAGTTGSRTLAANGIAVAIKLTATEWICDGVGLT